MNMQVGTGYFVRRFHDRNFFLPRYFPMRAPLGFHEFMVPCCTPLYNRLD
jgi:hypothetical protein